MTIVLSLDRQQQRTKRLGDRNFLSESMPKTQLTTLITTINISIEILMVLQRITKEEVLTKNKRNTIANPLHKINPTPHSLPVVLIALPYITVLKTTLFPIICLMYNKFPYKSLRKSTNEINKVSGFEAVSQINNYLILRMLAFFPFRTRFL